MAPEGVTGNENPAGGAEPEAGNQQQPTAQPAPAPQAPAERTFTQREYDAQFAQARRSFESQAARERQAAIDAARTEWARQNAPRPQPTTDPWSKFDPTVAAAMREVLEHELSQRLGPVREQQEDIALRNDEAEVRAKYPDYAKNRADILEFAVEHGISDVDTAYRAWKFEELSTIDPDAIGKAAIAAYTKRKTAQASATPSVEGRGGGAPSGKQAMPKDRDQLDEMAKELFRRAEESTA